MTPAQRRIEANRKLDAHRNAVALGAAREACIPDAVARLMPVLTTDGSPSPGGGGER